LPADRPDAVPRAQRLREPDHARAGRRPDADLFVLAFGELPNPGRGVEEECALQVHRRLDALVEDPDLGAVADPDDVALDGHLVAGAQLQDLLGIRDREGHLVVSHHASRSKSTVPSAAMWALARLAAQHW